MSTLRDLIQLAENDTSKFFVMNEAGEVKLVLMNMAEYQRLAANDQRRPVLDIERVNTEILQAQLKDTVSPPQVNVVKHPRVDLREEVIDPTFNFDAAQDDI